MRLPNSTHEQLKRLSKEEGSREEYEAALAGVPDAEPDPWDVWPADR